MKRLTTKLLVNKLMYWMGRGIRNYLLIAKLIMGVLLIATGEVSARTLSDLELSKLNYLQYQMWSLSRNYRFGTTLPKNAVNALAWQMVYVNSLPSSYPGKKKLLAPYKNKLSKEELSDSSQLANFYRRKYLLSYQTNEHQLYRAFELSEKKQSFASAKLQGSNSLEFPQILAGLMTSAQTVLAEKLRQRLRGLQEEQEYPVVYGQVKVRGREPAQMVNSPFPILEQGYFVSYAKFNYLVFSMPGYETVKIKINANLKVQNLGLIILNPIKNKEKTGFVASIIPWPGLEEGNIVLRVANNQRVDEDNPWYQPGIPFTLLNSGKLYATGLTPGYYELIVQLKDKKISKKFSVIKNHIKGLAPIDLRP